MACKEHNQDPNPGGVTVEMGLLNTAVGPLQFTSVQLRPTFVTL